MRRSNARNPTRKSLTTGGFAFSSEAHFDKLGCDGSSKTDVEVNASLPIGQPGRPTEKRAPRNLKFVFEFQSCEAMVLRERSVRRGLSEQYWALWLDQHSRAPIEQGRQSLVLPMGYTRFLGSSCVLPGTFHPHPLDT